MNGVGQRGARASPLRFLFVVERTPFWPAVRQLLSNDASTTDAYNLRGFVVSHQLGAAALWTDSYSRLSLHGFYWTCLWVFHHLSTVISLRGRILFVRRPILASQSLAS